MRKAIKALMEALEKQSSVTFAYLFGSRVEGSANNRSDWDVAVYFSESGEKVGPWRTFELEAELSRIVGATVQVTVLNDSLSPVFGFEIVKGGRVLLDRDESLRIEFENRTLRQYFDWQYFLKRQMKAEKEQIHS